jgi:uncharacterized iron-regulated membrane protein
MRRWFLLAHRWLTLSAGVFILLLSLSGAALSFEDEVDRALNPGLWSVTPGAAAVSLDTLVAHAQAAAPGKVVTGVMPSPEPDVASLLTTRDGLQIFLNPHTGAVLGTRTAAARAREPLSVVGRLHRSLLLGRPGNVIVGLTTIVSLVLLLSGAVLWWRDKIWRVRLSASWKLAVFDLHHLLGVAAVVVLVAQTGTGVAMGYRIVGRVISRLDRGASSSSPREAQVSATGAPAIALDEAARVARMALPGTVLMHLLVPPDPKQPLTAAVRFSEDRVSAPRSRVVIDRYRGIPLQVVSTRSSGLGTRINVLKGQLHVGSVWGTPTLVIWFLAALAMAGQVVTGLLMWWNGRPARKAAGARGEPAPA